MIVLTLTQCQPVQVGTDLPIQVKPMITIKEVARKAGVSIGTVDRVVHKRGRVARKTAERVEWVIRESGYKPNFFASRLSTSKMYQFAILMPDLTQDSRYWEMVAKGIERAKEELSPYHVKIHYFCYDRYSITSFQETGNKLIQADMDGILLAPVLFRPVQSFLKTVPETIPYIFFDASIPYTKALTFVGQDSFQSGRVAARLMQLFMRNEGSVAVILSTAGDYHIEKRAEGFQSYFHASAATVRRYILEDETGRNGFQRLLDTLVIQQPDLKGIFVTNAATHFVASYIHLRPFSRKPFLIGYDLIRQNVDYLKKGVIDILISQRAEMQGYEGIFALYRHVVLKQPCKKSIMMPIDIITKENLDYYNRY